MTDDAAVDPARLTVWVRGRVQGVGFRWWVRSRALELGLVGTATNRADGRVEIVVEGDRAAATSLLDLLTVGGGPGVTAGVAHRWGRPGGDLVGFVER